MNLPLSHTYQQVYPHPQETKLCIIIDSKTPIIMKTPSSPGSITLGQFKAIASLQHNHYKFYFKSHDSEFGVVKEEIVNDDSILPVDGDRIVVWVISNTMNQLSLFEHGDHHNDSRELSMTVDRITTDGITTSTDRPQPIYSNGGDHSRDSLYINVQLELNNYNFLGLTLVGPSEESNSSGSGIYVGEISKNSVVELDGRIEVGDKILEINGLDISTMKNDDAVATFRNCVDRRGTINLILQRQHTNLHKGRFTLPREYANSMSYIQTSPKLTQTDDRHKELPIPMFCPQSKPRVPQRRPDYKIPRGTHSLPRSITPRSLYANNFENLTASYQMSPRLESRSVYESTTPTSIRHYDIALHCARDDIHTIYSALWNDSRSLDIKDREWLKVIVKDAFLGSMLVKWLSRNVYGFSHKREIKQYANQMLNLGLIKSPMASGNFSEKCYYTLS